MGYDVLKTKCPHNRVLSRLEQCPQCIEQARARAVAKAGPEMFADGYGRLSEHWLDRIRREGVYDRATGNYTLGGCVILGVDVRAAEMRRRERETDERLAKIESMIEGMTVSELQAQLRNGDARYGDRWTMALCVRPTGSWRADDLISSTPYEEVDAADVKRVIAGMQQVCGLYLSKSRGPLPPTRTGRYAYLSYAMDA